MNEQANLHHLTRIAVFLTLALIVVACQGGTPASPTPTPTTQPAPLATSAPPVAVSPTPEPIPSATPELAPSVSRGQALSGNTAAGMGGETTVTPEPTPEAQASSRVYRGAPPEDENVAQSSTDTSDPLFIESLRRHRHRRRRATRRVRPSPALRRGPVLQSHLRRWRH